MREAMEANPFSRPHAGVAIDGSALNFVDEALPHLADDDFMQAADSHRRYWEEMPTPGVYDAVGGQCITRTRAAVALRRGRIDDAAEGFRRALTWCERERCPIEAGRCLHGLAEVAERRGDRAEALQLLDRAAALFRQHGAKLYLERVVAAKVRLQGVTASAGRSSIGLVVATVQEERPDISVHAAPDGSVTIMFSDIEDSTSINERLGDERWVAILREHNAVVGEQARAHGGAIVKHRGDGYMVAFAQPRAAVLCAVAIQRAIAARNAAHPQAAIAVRIGLHTGSPVREGADFFGVDVTFAARIADDVARGGEIVVSSRLSELLADGDGMDFADDREVELKGLAGTHRVYAIGWAAPPTGT